MPAEWLARVTGHQVPSWRHLDNEAMYLAVAAAHADAAHLEALAVAKRAEHEEGLREAAAIAAGVAQAARDEWAELRAALPVPVEVWHNWTARHLDGYEQGADHVVPLADLTVGRFHRRAKYPLCWTPSRAHQLRHVYGNVTAEDARRIPDCKACLRHAGRLGGQS